MNKSILALISVAGFLLAGLVFMTGRYVFPEQSFGGTVSPPASISWSTSHTVATISGVLKSSSAVFGGISCISTTGTTVYLQVHNVTNTTNLTGRIPLLTYLITGNTQTRIGGDVLGSGGLGLNTGLTIVESSSPTSTQPTLQGDLLCDSIYR